MVDLERAIISRNFLLSVLCMSLILALGTKFPSLNEYQSFGKHSEMVAGAVSSDACLLLLPLICTFPYTAAMLEELDCGYVKFSLIRTKRRSYIYSKILAAWLSGGLVIICAMLLNYACYWLIYSPVMLETQAYTELLTPLLLSKISVYLVGGICSLAGALLSLYVRSIYMAYIGPFTIYYFLVILKERYFEGLYSLYPKEWIAPQENWGTDNYGLYLFLGVLTLLLAKLYSNLAKRRLCDV